MSTRCGTIALSGRPNVGKSSLLNRLIGQKLSITAHKPQTTRHALLGISTIGQTQFVYIDTPGIHGTARKTLNRVLNKTASSAATGADVMVLVVQALAWTDDDKLALEVVKRQNKPWILAINKVDLVQPKEKLLPWMQELQDIQNAAAVVPVSATKGANIDALQNEIEALLPRGDFMFEEDALTDRSSRFLASELRIQVTLS
ncbi:MAG: GTPase Era [Pseudomonadota bacterium]